MKLHLLKEISGDTSAYQKRLGKIAKKINEWALEIHEEKRLGLRPMEQLIGEAGYDPYNSANNQNQRGGQNDSIDFSPQPDVQRPVIDQNTRPKRMHIVYDPSSGEVSKAIKTGLMSRPPADYMEANAQQVQDALKHLESMNPKLADLLVSGSLSIWVPRNTKAPSGGPMGLEGGSGPGGHNVRNMSPDQMAHAQSAADRMSTVK